MKRLYESSLGRLELELDPASITLSICLFDADGRVAAESGDEWEQADVPDLLHSEIGLPSSEAQSIGDSFLETARAEGHRQAEPSGAVGTALGLGFVSLVLVLLGVGLWTVVRWIV